MLELKDHWLDEIFDVIRLFIWILDPQGKVIRANLAAQKLNGGLLNKITGAPIWSIPWRGLPKESKKTLKWMHNQALRAQTTRNEIHIQVRGQPGMVINFSFMPILSSNGETLCILVEGRDITEYRRASDALNQSEARFKTIFEEAGVGILIKKINGMILDSNPAFQAMLGYSAEEITKFNYLDITYPQDRRKSRKLFDELVNGKRKNYVIEKRYLQKDGQSLWARITASLVPEPNHEAQFVITIVENINNQKEIANEISELQRRLMHGREMERLRLAQELHDGPLQEIIDIAFQLKDLESTITGLGSQEQFQTIQSKFQGLAGSLRTICGELRPPTLIPFGLEKTIRSHAKQFQETHQELMINLDLDEDGQALSESIRIVLFRIYQVALNNIMRHANAQQVQIVFRLDEDEAILKIRDDGKGFKLPERWIDLARQGHLGIVGARERAREVGGDLDVITKPGKGTTVQAVVPLNGSLSLYPGEEEKL